MNQASLDLPLRPPTRVAYIHDAVMTGISLRLAWHSFRPSPLGVQGDVALSVLGWVDAKCTPIDMSSLVEPSNQCQPNPNWCHPGSPCTEHVSRLVSLLRLFGRFNSVSISRLRLCRRRLFAVILPRSQHSATFRATSKRAPFSPLVGRMPS